MKRKNKPYVPPFRIHKATQQAYVIIDGARRYLGRHDAPETRERYAQTIAEWNVSNGANTARATDVTILELANSFRKHAESYYGPTSKEPGHFKIILDAVLKLYARTPAVEFGPRRFKAVRQTFIDGKRSRRHVNQLMGRLKHVFKWAAGEELLPGSVYQNLQAVSGLKYGRCEARETEPVKPVADAIVELTIQHCTPTVAAMIRLQQLTGARSGEICILRSADVDMSGTVWTYTPTRHKTAYRGRHRVIYLGPRAQEVLKPFLQLDTQAYLFTPEQSELERREKMHLERVTPASCGNVPGSNRKRSPNWKPGDRFDASSFRQSIQYATEKAFPTPAGMIGADAKKWRREHDWHPHRLRHSYATHVRREHGLEAAQILLGHAKADITQTYAERDTTKAQAVALKIG